MGIKPPFHHRTDGHRDLGTESAQCSLINSNAYNSSTYFNSSSQLTNWKAGQWLGLEPAIMHLVEECWSNSISRKLVLGWQSGQTRYKAGRSLPPTVGTKTPKDAGPSMRNKHRNTWKLLRNTKKLCWVAINYMSKLSTKNFYHWSIINFKLKAN